MESRLLGMVTNICVQYMARCVGDDDDRDGVTSQGLGVYSGDGRIIDSTSGRVIRGRLGVPCRVDHCVAWKNSNGVGVVGGSR